ncbi:MAG: BON domain-containing protein [Magnetococcales bacterium]|nr:BON domain-containing protein [Magnetococcales bacterium]
MTCLRVLLAGVVVLAGMPVLSGCVPMDSPNGSISSGFLGERRSPDAAIEDNLLAMKLRSYYMRSDKVSLANINVSVYQGEVLLTGTAASQEEIDTALDIAKNTRGVGKVHSELKVQHATLGDHTKDAWYTNEVKVRLLADEYVRGLDIRVETTKGIVYLTGTAQSVAERTRAIEIARQVSGVKEVVSYINVDGKSQPLSPKAESKPEKSPTVAPVRMGDSAPTDVPLKRGNTVTTAPIPSGSPKPGASIDSGF